MPKDKPTKGNKVEEEKEEDALDISPELVKLVNADPVQLLIGGIGGKDVCTKEAFFTDVWEKKAKLFKVRRARRKTTTQINPFLLPHPSRHNHIRRISIVLWCRFHIPSSYHIVANIPRIPQTTFPSSPAGHCINQGSLRRAARDRGPHDLCRFPPKGNAPPIRSGTTNTSK